MHLFSLFIISQVLSISLSQDAQSKYDKQIINNSANNLNLNEPLEKPYEPKPIAKGLEKFLQHTIKKGTETRNRSIELMEYVDHMKQQGLLTFKYVAKEIMKVMQAKKVMEVINAGTNNYLVKIHNYLYFIAAPNGGLIFDEDFVFLDVSEVACRLLYREQKNILDNIVAKKLTNNNEAKDYSASVELTEPYISHKLLVESIKNVSNIIYRNNIVLRKTEVQYICYKYKVCRPYPAFSDYCGYLLSGILRLPIGKFEIFARLLGTIMKLNQDLMTTAIRSQDILITEIDKLCSDWTTVNGSLEILKDILSQKFNIMRNPNLKPKLRALAVRKLLDVVDESFKDDYHDRFVLQYHAIATAFSSWAKDKTPVIAENIFQFINRIFQIFNQIIHSDKSSRKKIIILIERLLNEGNQHYDDYVKNNFIRHFDEAKKLSPF